MNIIQKKWEFLNSTVFYVPQQAKKLYTFGLATLCARSITSLRANARILSLNWYTAKSKVYRLTKNTKITQSFHVLVPLLAPVSSFDCVAIDFSDFGNGFQILLFAKQTNDGRALPLYFEILRYPIQKDSQNLFVIAAIHHFTALVGVKPLFVLDRGFACPVIIEFLQENQYPFVLRIKGGKHVKVRNGRKVAARNRTKSDGLVGIYGDTFRLVVSDRPTAMSEPWYLVTNDLVSTREDIVDIYYHRFEIEEFFRDAKRLLGLEGVRSNTEATLAILLWFTILGTWCMRHLEILLGELRRRERHLMRLSNIRYLFEKLQATCILAAEGRYFHTLCR